MANDGQDDFYTITRLAPQPSTPAAGIVVLSNSVLIASMIVQEALNASSLLWMALVYSAIDGARRFLLSAAAEHHLPLEKVRKLFEQNVPLAKSRNADLHE